MILFLLVDTNVPDGGWRAMLRMGRLFWIPFEDHFSHFQQRFRTHREALRNDLLQYSESSKILAYAKLGELNRGAMEHFRHIQSDLKRK
jgi:hypothetical protein